jgi:uncharacterized protein
MIQLEALCDQFMVNLCNENPDPSHDILHVRRVVKNAKLLAIKENADLQVVIPAAYLHDCVYISKSDHRRSQASQLSATKAYELLSTWNYPTKLIPAVQHAISSHSFSAGIMAETLEAKIVQDADRLDAMGAIGTFRCFAFSGLAKRPLYNEQDPFCLDGRAPDDTTNTLDHFFVKLLRLQDKLNTNTAKLEGHKRLQTMRVFLDNLQQEVL